MNKALLPAGILALLLSGCGPSEKTELTGRPLVLQLGIKISTATSTAELDALQTKLATTSLGAKVQEHLTKAIESQRALLAGAAEMQMNERMDGAKKVLAEVEAASAAVE